MCLAIVKPVGRRLDYEEMRLAWCSNPDGAGFTARVRKVLVTVKGMYEDFDDFWEAWTPYADCTALVHFRWATLGTVNKDNCHPFLVDKYAAIHNGHFAGYGTKEISDTRHWLDGVLGPLLRKYPGLVHEPGFQQLIGDAIRCNKVALLGPTGDPVIFNESLGIWRGGIWYSNEDFLYLGDTTPAVDAKADTLEGWWDERQPYTYGRTPSWWNDPDYDVDDNNLR